MFLSSRIASYDSLPIGKRTFILQLGSVSSLANFFESFKCEDHCMNNLSTSDEISSKLTSDVVAAICLEVQKQCKMNTSEHDFEFWFVHRLLTYFPQLEHSTDLLRHNSLALVNLLCTCWILASSTHFAAFVDDVIAGLR
jgi:hypothetical protein